MTKREDDKEFLARWIAFGMALKNKADGYGVEWRGKPLETWMHEITDAEVWHQTEEQCTRR